MSTKKKTKLKVYRTPDGHSMVMSKEKMLELARTEWDSSKTMAENQIQVEDHAYTNAQLWMTPCHGLTMETLQAIAEGGDIESLILEIGDYEGPTALLVDAAAWLTGRKEWRKAFRPVLDAAGWQDGADGQGQATK